MYSKGISAEKYCHSGSIEQVKFQTMIAYVISNTLSKIFSHDYLSLYNGRTTKRILPNACRLYTDTRATSLDSH